MPARPRMVLVAATALTLALAATPAQSLGPPVLTAQSVLLLDPGGRTIFAKNPDDDRAPASLVKLMTIYLALEDLEAGRVTPDELVTVSRHAAFTPHYRMGLRTGEQVPLRVLIDAVAIASANDAATALAEHLGGDEATFVDRMNAKAVELGLVATRFANPHGLPDPGQRSSARDLALLTVRLLEKHPEARDTLGAQAFVHRGRTYKRNIPLFNDPGGVQALKTGFTNEAGYNLAVSAWHRGQQFLMIVLGARTRALSFLDARKLLHFGFVEAGLEIPAKPAKPRGTPRKPVKTRRPSRGLR